MCEVSAAHRARNIDSVREAQRARNREVRARATAKRKAQLTPEAIAAAMALSKERTAARRARQNAAKRAKYAANPEPFKERGRRSKAARREATAAYKRAIYSSQRECRRFVLNTRMRNRMGQALRRGKGGVSWTEVAGYSVDELMAHLERQFVRGMGWNNMGEWHIDHIVPLATFRYESASDPEFKRAWALTNLRPLWAKENFRKGARATSLI